MKKIYQITYEVRGSEPVVKGQDTNKRKAERMFEAAVKELTEVNHFVSLELVERDSSGAIVKATTLQKVAILKRVW